MLIDMLANAGQEMDLSSQSTIDRFIHGSRHLCHAFEACGGPMGCEDQTCRLLRMRSNPGCIDTDSRKKDLQQHSDCSADLVSSSSWP